MKTFEEALNYLLTNAKLTSKTKVVSVENAKGLVLAESLVSDINVPAFDNSMMDGYVIGYEDFSIDKVYKVSQRIPAGTLPAPLQKGTIARIFTGAPLPVNGDTVIMQEEAVMLSAEEGGGVKFSKNTIQKAQSTRLMGSDIAKGQVALEKGHRINSEDLGLISSIGIEEVKVYEPIKIATFTTGDELLEPGEAWVPGKIYNANRYFLKGLIPQNGFEIIDLGRVEDTLKKTIEVMQEAAALADVVMTTGGVSVGEEDHIKPALDRLGSLDMWKVKMKPGKPLAYGLIGDVPFIGLPGNPVSAFATFQLFARPYLLKMQGAKLTEPNPIWVSAAFSTKRANFRREYARAKLVNKEQTTTAELFPNQSSGVLNSVSWADGFVVIPEDTLVSEGDKVAFYSFNDFK